MRTEAESPVLAAGALEGDLMDQANADAEAELQVRLHESVRSSLTLPATALGERSPSHRPGLYLGSKRQRAFRNP